MSVDSTIQTPQAPLKKGWRGPPGSRAGGAQFVKKITGNHAIDPAQLDGRTRARRTYNALVAGITADLGGPDELSTVEKALIQDFAGVSIHKADLNARLLQGDPIDLQEHVATIGAMVRLTSRLGVRRRPKNVSPDAFASFNDLSGAVAGAMRCELREIEEEDEAAIRDTEGGN